LDAYDFYLFRIHHPLLLEFSKYAFVLLTILVSYIVGAFAYILGDLLLWIVLSSNWKVSPELVLEKLRRRKFYTVVENGLTLNDFINAAKANTWNIQSHRYFELSLFFSGMFATVTLSNIVLIVFIALFYFLEGESINWKYCMVTLALWILIISLKFKIPYFEKLSNFWKWILRIVCLFFCFYSLQSYFLDLKADTMKLKVFLIYSMLYILLLLSLFISLQFRQISNLYLLLASESNKRVGQR